MTTETMPANQNDNPGEFSRQGSFVYIEKIIEGFPHYAIANNGNLISLPRAVRVNGGIRLFDKSVLEGGLSNSGYRCAVIYNTELEIKATVYHHKLVANYFICKRPSLNHVINHKDGNKQNNSATNLEWITWQENRLHAIYVLGKIPKGTRGLAHSSCLKTQEMLKVIKRLSVGGFSNREIAKELHISHTFINSVLNEKH